MKKLILLLLLGGCASLPPIPPSGLPLLQGYGQLPNCVIWCHVIVTVERADSKIDSSGEGAVTAGAQSQASTVDVSTTETKTRSEIKD
jgi:hypothetical protein